MTAGRFGKPNDLEMVMAVGFVGKRVGKTSQREDMELTSKREFLVRNIRAFVN